MQAKATGGSSWAGGRQPEPEPPPPTKASGERSNTHTWPDFTWINKERREWRIIRILVLFSIYPFSLNYTAVLPECLSAVSYFLILYCGDSYCIRYLFYCSFSLLPRHVGMDTGCLQRGWQAWQLHTHKTRYSQHNILNASLFRESTWIIDKYQSVAGYRQFHRVQVGVCLPGHPLARREVKWPKWCILISERTDRLGADNTMIYPSLLTALQG